MSNLIPHYRTICIDEPELVFGDDQTTIDPREGLILFGPYEKFAHHSIQAGVIATEKGLKLYREFVDTINQPLISTKWNHQSKSQESDEQQRPSFPGFEAVFGVRWNREPQVVGNIPPLEINRRIRTISNKRKRTAALVDLYLNKILETKDKEDVSPNIWFVVVPKELYEVCRPQSRGRDMSTGSIDYLEQRIAGQEGLFDDSDYVNELRRLLSSSSDFHDLFKARLIQERVEAPVQIFVEPKLRFRDILRGTPYEPNMRAHLAWTISTTVYYKLGRLPWKLAGARSGVCYIGLVFKRANDLEQTIVGSAAQMFLKDGDGAVFRGHNGLWEVEETKEYHLDENEAHHLLSMALQDYFDKWNQYPKEMFIHGRVEFSDREWAGFQKAVSERNADTALVGVVIKDKAPMKLFREAPNQRGRYGVMRGIGVIINGKEAYLNTRGFVPHLNTSLSIEIPNALYVKVVRGDAEIETVMSDVLSLTKLNYNACIYGDGKPVTLSFSDNIGRILTATEEWKVDTRQFKYYI